MVRRIAALAHRIGPRGREVNRAKKGGDGLVPEKPIEMRYFEVLTY
jgi:hypothetical protein